MSQRLKANQQYRIIQDFTDYYGTLIKAGTSLKFISQNFSPYHGGYTFEFAEMNIYLQEDDHAAILSNFDAYFQEASE